MVVRPIQRTLRLYDIEIRRRETHGRWQRITFRSIAELLQELPVDVSAHPNRYYVTNGERWFLDFRDTDTDPLYAVCYRGRAEDFPVIERDGNTSRINLEEDQTLAERNVFGIYNANRLMFQVSRHGFRTADLKLYLELKTNEILRHRGETREIQVDITQPTRPTFENVMQQAIRFTRIHMRPRYDAIGILNEMKPKSSMMSILSRLSKMTRQTTEIKISAGRHPTTDDAFLEEFANWARENIQTISQDNLFEILEGSALLRSGEIRLFDLLNRHLYEKRVGMRLDDGILDTDHAIERLSGVYNTFINEENRGE